MWSSSGSWQYDKWSGSDKWSGHGYGEWSGSGSSGWHGGWSKDHGWSSSANDWVLIPDPEQVMVPVEKRKGTSGSSTCIPDGDDTMHDASSVMLSVPDGITDPSAALSVPDGAAEGGPKWPLTTCDACGAIADWREMLARKVYETREEGSPWKLFRTCIECIMKERNCTEQEAIAYAIEECPGFWSKLRRAEKSKRPGPRQRNTSLQ